MKSNLIEGSVEYALEKASRMCDEPMGGFEYRFLCAFVSADGVTGRGIFTTHSMTSAGAWANAGRTARSFQKLEGGRKVTMLKIKTYISGNFLREAFPQSKKKRITD